MPNDAMPTRELLTVPATLKAKLELLARVHTTATSQNIRSRARTALAVTTGERSYFSPDRTEVPRRSSVTTLERRLG